VTWSTSEAFYSSEMENINNDIISKFYDFGTTSNTGRLSTEEVYHYEDFIFDVGSRITTTYRKFDVTNDLQTFTSLIYSESERVFNDQGLVVEARSNNDQNIENGFDEILTWDRDADGRVLSVFSDKGFRESFEYDSNGVLTLNTQYVKGQDAVSVRNKIYYMVLDGKKVVVVESENFRDPNPSYFSTTIKFLEEIPCHQQTKNRIRTSGPTSAICFDPANWR
jgi:YD repeat-containing protein